MIRPRSILTAFAAALSLSAAADLPKVWMTYKPGKDEVAELTDMKAHGVDVVQFGCSGVKACRKHLDALKATGLKMSFQVQDVTEYFSTIRLNGLEPVPATMIGGVYRGKAIDRHVFEFAATKHEIVIEPPVYNAGFSGKKGTTGMSGPTNGEPIGHYLPGTVPVKAEIVVALRKFDGRQHLKIVPATISEAPQGTALEIDSVQDPKYFSLSEYRDRKLYRLAFDLSGLNKALLDRVGIAVYWNMMPPPEGYPGFRDGMVSPAAESTREATRRETLRRIDMWAEANGGEFPKDLLACVRFGDECFVTSCHLGGPAVSYPLWDYSEPALARFRAAAGAGLEPPRTWGHPDIYGADAYALWQWSFHKACAELAGIVRDAVHERFPGVPVFRNTTRNTVFALANDHDGTGQELLARELDLVHLDPYPVHGAGWEGYTEAIPTDMSYCGGLARRFGKPLVPWMQAHTYSKLTDPTPEQIVRMCDEQWKQGIDAVQWLGYGYTFPKKQPESWEEAAKFHARLHRETSPKPKAELAVLRPYSVWALSNQEDENTLRNPADWMLQQFLLAWSVDLGRAYDVFEVPPRMSAAEKAHLKAELARYRYVVSTRAYPGAKVIGKGTEGTTVDLRTAKAVREGYVAEIRKMW